LREAWQARFLSRAGLAFDHFKRARQRMAGRDVAGAVAPATPGLVSIVLPVHNGGALLRETLESVLAQRYAAWELIVVDDGSTDDSAATARGYAARDPRVRVIQQSWQKLPAALNHGFAQARGEFLTWASADNRLRPDALAKLVDCLRRHPRWDVAYANLDLIGDDGAPLADSPHFRSYQRPAGSAQISLPASTDELNTRDNNFIGAGFLYRRRGATLIGDYSPFRFGLEDYDYWMRANALLTVRKADFEEAVVEYRFHDASLTARAQALDLPAARTRLQIFDGFRRDSALWPLIWIVDPSLSMAAPLLQRIREAGHVIYDASYALDALPGPWVPFVVVSDNAWFEPAPEGHATLRVIVERAELSAPVAVPSGWDLRVRIGNEVPRDWPDDDRRSLLVPDLNHLFHAIDIRARSVLSAAIESLAEAPPPSSLTASIVVCAARDIPTLPDVVSAALGQQFPPDQFEVIVVNNTPGDAALGAALRRLPPHVRVVPCPFPGHSAARNAGLGAARGRYVCYLDDDAIPGDGWLDALCRAFEGHPDAGVIGGPILLEPPSPAPAAFTAGWAQFWSHFAPPFSEYREVSDRSAFPWGANWAARRDVLYQIGGFRLAVGRRGQDHRGGEELVAAELAQRLGRRIGIAPEATVRHRVDAARFTTAHVRGTQAARHLVAQAVARDDVFEHRGGVTRSVMRLLAHHVDPRVRAWPHALQDVAYRKAAQWLALRADVADFRRRFKRRARED
jgi:glycosyltransferase involved in cell wall biosynthesis